MGFGHKMRDLMPSLLADSRGKPNPVPPSFSAVAFIQNLDVSSDHASWPEANLHEVVRYLRGSRLLKLPDAVKAAFPQTALDQGRCGQATVFCGQFCSEGVYACVFTHRYTCNIIHYIVYVI